MADSLRPVEKYSCPTDHVDGIKCCICGQVPSPTAAADLLAALKRYPRSRAYSWGWPKSECLICGKLVGGSLAKASHYKAHERRGASVSHFCKCGERIPLADSVCSPCAVIEKATVRA
jgi:hypothetical protein